MGRIRLEGVGKCYRRYPNRWSRLLEWIDPDDRIFHEPHWVLSGITLEVEPGEAVGLIGHNGAGKSTLLKIITGTTRATRGTVEVEGRVAALLELGMGFHPEFTGRQNVAMAAQLLGLSAPEIATHMGDIEAFAGIGAYIDEPLRTYSSGMQMRLAFAVATAVRPDVLIVDEALAVGDIYFQQKCFARIESYVKQGTTLLFVSHSMGTVLNLCNRAVLLDGGRVKYLGEPKHAIDLYQQALIENLSPALASGDVAFAAVPIDVPMIDVGSAMESTIAVAPNERAATSEALADAGLVGGLEPSIGSITTTSVDFLGVRLARGDGTTSHALVAGEDASIELHYRLRATLADPHVGFKIRDRYGVVLFETNSYCMGRRVGTIAAGTVLVTTFRFRMRLAPGEYTITAGFANGGYGEGHFEEALDFRHEVVAFTVLANPASPRWTGLVDLEPTVSIGEGRRA